MRSAYIEPITDNRADFLYEELYRHRNRKHTGRCHICARVSCQATWQAMAELLMAGREIRKPSPSRWWRRVLT